MLEGYKDGYHTGPGYKLLYQRSMCMCVCVWGGTCLVLGFCVFDKTHQPVHSVGRKYISGFATLLEGGRLRKRKVMMGATRHIHPPFTKARGERLLHREMGVAFFPAGSPGRDKMEVLSRSQVTPFCVFTFSLESSQIS